MVTQQTHSQAAKLPRAPYVPPNFPMKADETESDITFEVLVEPRAGIVHLVKRS